MKEEGRPTRAPVARLAAAAAVLAALVAAPLPIAAAPPRDAAIAALLERRAAAVRGGDEEAFLATISPLASPDFRARQRAAFARLTALPLDRYGLRARWDFFGDLVRPSDWERYAGADDVAIPVTQERMTIEGFDAHPAVEDLYLTFVRDGEEWGIAADDDLADLALLSARRIWEFGPVESMRGENFLLLYHPDVPPAEATLGLAEEALARVDRYWGGRWARRVPIVVPADEAELQRMLQITVDLSNFVAFAYATVDDRNDYRFSGTRILLNPAAISTRSASALSDVLAHELAHAATRRSSGPLVPLWMEEGVAEQVRYRGGAPVLSFLAGRSDGRLPLDAEFQFGESADILEAYLEGYSAVRFFIQRYGLRDMRRFFARVGRERTAFGTQRYHVDQALRSTVGLSLRKFERKWAGSI